MATSTPTAGKFYSKPKRPELDRTPGSITGPQRHKIEYLIPKYNAAVAACGLEPSDEQHDWQTDLSQWEAHQMMTGLARNIAEYEADPRNPAAAATDQDELDRRSYWERTGRCFHS